jgi:hypothetical protein
MYRPSLHLVLQITSWRFGELKELIMEVPVVREVILLAIIMVMELCMCV